MPARGDHFGGDVYDYQPRHARTPDPAELPPILRGLADLIQPIDSEEQ